MTARPLRVLIAGCGYIGQPLAACLLDAGAEVHALRRTLPAVAGKAARPGLVWHAADLTDAPTLSQLPAPFDVVLYTASAAGRADEASYRAIYVDGLRNLIESLRPAPRRLIFCSSTAVYGQHAGEWVDERSVTAPSGFQGQVLLSAEQLAASWGSGACVVRFGGIYGPGRTRLLQSVLDGTARCPPAPHFTNRMHRDDCAAALLHLVRAPAVMPLYVAVDDDPAPLDEVLRWLAVELGVPPPPTGESARAQSGSKRCRNARLRAAGLTLRYPSYREGYAPLVAEQLARGADSARR